MILFVSPPSSLQQTTKQLPGIAIMKLAVLATIITSATAFMGPSLQCSRARSTPLRETVEETDTFQGSEAISSLTSGVSTVFTSEDIAKTLPHRYPFALVDKVVEYEEGKVGSAFEA